MKSRTLSILFVVVLLLGVVAGCANTPASTTASAAATATEPATDSVAEPTTESTAEPTAEDTTVTTESATTEADATDASSDASLTFDNAAWNYDEDNDVYWQIGVQYVANPETTEYETLGIYIPGAYVTATANGDGSYTLAIDDSGAVNGFTAQSAPIVLPMNTPGYSAAQAPTEYSYDQIASYLEAGFIYVQPGLRGRDNGYDDSGALIYSGGAPWGVTDMKAAIRYIRYNDALLPGSGDAVFVFGMSGGGAQSTIVGASGDSELYYPYLESIGAAMVDADGQPISDAVNGVMAWCPITSLDYADAAYEWNMGQFASSETRAEETWTSALSSDFATAYAEYINALGITDAAGNVLTLAASDAGIYTAGSYYDAIVAVVEESLNNFLVDTTFPYTVTAGGGLRGAGGPPSGEMPQGGPTEGGTRPTGEVPTDATATGDDSSTEATATTYATVQEYIDSLNAETQWITYDAATNTVNVTSLAGFVNSQKNASKSVGAFDDLARSQAENNVFGTDESDSLHFDAVLAGLLAANQEEYATYADWDAAYVDAYTTDLTAVDKLGSSIQTRVDMYNPMYYLLPYYAGYQTSTVAENWRIRTGITQGDTALTVETNLSLALQALDSVESVDFATVWGQGHTMAERTGNSTDNFIAWVTDVVNQ